MAADKPMILPLGLSEWLSNQLNPPYTKGEMLSADRALYERGFRDGMQHFITYVQILEDRQERSRHG